MVKNVPTGYEQVLPAIVIKVRDPVGPPGHFQGRTRQATAARDINKDAAAAIVEQGKSLEFGGRVPDVGQAVVIEIAKLRSHP